MSFAGRRDGIQRKHPRKTYCNVMTFCLTSGSLNDTLTGVSINVSDSGMCFYSPARLKEGEEILIQERRPVRYRRASVIWVKDYLTGLYKIGLEFHERVKLRL
jgi:hypothetical protein